ncbi:C-type lectin 37Db-like [Drosophila innubila]|uniref:C-type lectin 37Db-like n=1 Tax=Drosophila innubila TaxID=198719 RepID=UPI00148E16DB|nr:C-type lectin 37Db-like [Drosophila innubila]
MRNILIWILISVIVVQASKENCKESSQLESSCGSYCFKVVRPILDHAKMLQSRVENDEVFEKNVVRQRLEHIEALLHEFNTKFNSLERTIQQQEAQRNDMIKTVNKLAFEKIGSKYYYIEQNQRLNWFAAAHKCHELGGHLASLQNLNDLVAVSAKLKNRFYWIDINDLAKEGEYNSLTTGLRASFLKWYCPDEPNNKDNNEHCVQLREVNKDYTMNDVRCDETCNFICEREFN